jgi:hypothetical protein
MLGILGTTGDQQSLDGIFTSNTGLPTRSIRFQTGPTGVACYVGQSGVDLLILLGNLPGVQAAVAFVNGNNIGSVINPSAVRNIWCLEQAQGVIAQMAINGRFATSGRITIAGFSGGGAVAIYLNAAFQQAAVGNPLVITFGAPKPGGSDLGRLVGPNYVRRWMNNDDAVPFLPTSQIYPLFFLTSYTINTIQGWSHFVQPPGGVVLNADGSYAPGTLPTTSPSGPNGDAAQWVLAYMIGAANPHNIAEYERRLTLAVDATPRAPATIPRAAPIEVANPAQRQEVAQAQRAAESTIFRTGAVQNANPVEIPVSAGFLAQRTGPIWVVTFGGVTVAIGPTKRRSRALARSGNDYLRHLQVQAGVDSAALSQSVVTYLGLAGIPGNGFVPTMNVVSP